MQKIIRLKLGTMSGFLLSAYNKLRSASSFGCVTSRVHYILHGNENVHKLENDQTENLKSQSRFQFC